MKKSDYMRYDIVRDEHIDGVLNEFEKYEKDIEKIKTKSKNDDDLFLFCSNSEKITEIVDALVKLRDQAKGFQTRYEAQRDSLRADPVMHKMYIDWIYTWISIVENLNSEISTLQQIQQRLGKIKSQKMKSASGVIHAKSETVAGYKKTKDRE